ncbi:MAG: hypothetical protein AB2610_20840 [Candidatus Thiodiazotropha sp.]
MDKPKYQDNIDGTRREFVRLYSQSCGPRPAYSVKGEWYFLGIPGMAEYIQTTTNWEASKYYKGIVLLQANERVYDATVCGVMPTSQGSIKQLIHP